MAGYIGSKSSVTQVDGYNKTEADAEFLNDPASVITVAGSNVGIGTSSPEEKLHVKGSLKVDFGSAGGNPRVYLDHDSATDDGNYLQLNRGDDSLEVVGQDNVKIRTNGSEVMRIDSSGRVTMPYQPSFRASFSNINYNQSGGITPVFNYTEHNRGNHYNTSTGVFTAPVAGSYLFSMGMAAEATSTAGFFVMELMVNGAIDYTKFSTSAANTGISEGGVSGSVVCSLQANDAVKVVWYTPVTISVGRATGGANVWWNGRNYFSGCFLG